MKNILCFVVASSIILLCSSISFAEETSQNCINTNYSASHVMSSFNYDEGLCPQPVDLDNVRKIEAKVIDFECNALMCEILLKPKKPNIPPGGGGFHEHEFAENMKGIICPDRMEEIDVCSLKEKIISRTVSISGNLVKKNKDLYIIYIDSEDSIEID